MENKILNAACWDRSAYDKIVLFRASDSISDKGKIVLKAIGDYYRADPNANKIDKQILEERLTRDFPKHSDLFKAIVNSFEEVSVPNIISEIIALKKVALKERLAAACTAGDKDDEIDKLYRELETIRLKENHSVSADIYRATSATEVVEQTTGQNLIKILPKEVNAALGGGVLRKHHIVIFARPDVGKTAFCINLVEGFLRQNLVVLYIGNEDPVHHILKRTMSRITQMPQKQIDAFPEKANALLAKRNWDNFIFAEMYPGSPSEIRELVEEYSPDILFVDQARNLDMRENNRVLQLESACKFVRDISKKHNMVGVSVVQAGDSAENKLILGMGDVDFSNTGIPATADLMLGLGCNQDYEQNGHRMISFPKNKINGNKEPVRVPIEFNTFRMG